MRREISLLATAVVVVTGCADPCVDDGINQENKGAGECPALTGANTETDSASASASETESASATATVSASVTDDATAGSQSASDADADATASASATDTDSASASASATADTTEGVNECPLLDITVTHEDPTIMLLVDQSGSMTADLDGASRWDTLRNTLLDPDIGVVVWFESAVVFGLTLYSNTLDDPECPELIVTPPLAMGYDEIAATFDAAQPAEHTPTGESLALVAAQLAKDPSPGDKVIVLATDGEPDTCAMPDPQMGQQESIDAAAAAHAMGIPVFVVSVGTDTSEQHLQDVANAGAGVGPGDPDAPFFVAVDQPSLAQAFVDIISSTQDCIFAIDADLMDGGAETCVLSVNGDPLALDDPNGWRTNGPGEIELLGEACDSIQESEAAVEMVCQCDAVEGR